MRGKTLLVPLDEEVEEYFRAYSYCKLFHCSITEYEARPMQETIWMLKIAQAHGETVMD